MSARIYIGYLAGKNPPYILDIKQAATHVARNLQNPEGAKTQVLFTNNWRDISQTMIDITFQRKRRGRKCWKVVGPPLLTSTNITKRWGKSTTNNYDKYWPQQISNRDEDKLEISQRGKYKYKSNQTKSRINAQGKGGGETINLEKQFVKGLQNLGGTNGLWPQELIDFNVFFIFRMNGWFPHSLIDFHVFYLFTNEWMDDFHNFSCIFSFQTWRVRTTNSPEDSQSGMRF